jgi:hypothetical protein
MDDSIVYFPYRVLKYASLFFFLFGLFFTFILGKQTAPIFNLQGLIFVGVVIVCFVIAIYFYVASNYHIIFYNDGLRVFDLKHRNGIYLSWGELRYAYYVRNYRNFIGLVLSPNKLDIKRAKKFFNLDITLLLIRNSCVIIPMPLAHPEKIEELIDSKVENVNKDG